MRVIVYCYGSRGDVQPYAALAAGLARAGHHATLVAPARFAPLATVNGVEFAGLNDEMLDLLELPEVQRMYLADAKPPSAEIKRVASMLRQRYHELYPILLDEYWQAAEGGCDVVVHSQSNAEAVHQIAERLGAARALAVLYPFYVPSRHYPSTLLGSLGTAPRLLNRLSHAVSRRRRPAAEVAAAAQRWRATTLRLPPRDDVLTARTWAGGGQVPVLHGFSRHVLPPAPDWPSGVYTAGAWMLPTDPSWQPSRDLVEFLDSGPSPIFVGFGSLLGSDPVRTGERVVSAIRASGHRAVVVTGRGGISIPKPPAEILVTEDVPYGWLFPRVRLAVHAGGSGTLHAAAAAGLPQVACPFHREQAQWSRRLSRLGVAPAPVHQRTLTAHGLAAAIDQVETDRRYRDRAQSLGEKIRAEDGVGGAVQIIAGLRQRAADRQR